MSGHRQAAAALYGLARADQDCILIELGERDQSILRGYLAELSELGFDKAANMAPATDAGQRSIDDAPAPPAVHLPSVFAAADPRARLRLATASEVFSVVAQEPAALTAQILALEAWPWADALLDMLPTSRCAQVQVATDAGVRCAPARARFLVDALSARLADPMPAQFGARHIHLARALKKWLPWIR